MTECFMALSTVTDRPYVSTDMTVYGFEKETEGHRFAERHKDMRLGFKPLALTKPVLKNLYLNAIEKIDLLKADGSHQLIILSEKDFRAHLGNREAAKNLILLEQTGIKKYLRNLYECEFYMPVHMDIRKKGQVQKIHTCKALRKERESRLLFVTAGDFDEWARNQDKRWNAVRVTFKEVLDMAGGADINIHKHLLIDAGKLKIIKEGIDHGKKGRREKVVPGAAGSLQEQA